eukprot:6438737-Amphidinium_carterae.1
MGNGFASNGEVDSGKEAKMLATHPILQRKARALHSESSLKEQLAMLSPTLLPPSLTIATIAAAGTKYRNRFPLPSVALDFPQLSSEHPHVQMLCTALIYMLSVLRTYWGTAGTTNSMMMVVVVVVMMMMMTHQHAEIHRPQSPTNVLLLSFEPQTNSPQQHRRPFLSESVRKYFSGQAQPPYSAQRTPTSLRLVAQHSAQRPE